MGRTRQFDEAVLIDAAIDLFWSKGFDGTSVEEISGVSGVGNGSIYAAYGSKMGLFLTVFQRYCQRRAEFVRETVDAAPGPPRAAMAAFFEAVIADCAAYPDHRGCLMINSIAQLGHRVPEVVEISSDSTMRMEAHIAHRIRTSAKKVDEQELSALAAHIVMVSQGLIQLSRLGTPRGRLREIAHISTAGLPAHLVG